MKQDKIMIKRVGLVCFFFSIFIFGTILMFIWPVSVKSTYGLTTRTIDGETITFSIFEPEGNLYKAYNGDREKIVVLIGHGFMGNKEMHKGYAIELAAAGFVAVTFDFRGHGQSTGELLRDRLIYDVEAVKNYILTERDDIDTKNFAYIGYSMGASVGNLIVKKDKDFKSFVCAGNALPSTAEDAVKVSSNRKLNILEIAGKYDEIITVERLKTGMAVRLGINPDELQLNRLYGSFEKGDASMIYVDDTSNHIFGHWDQDFIREARNWIMNSFPDVKAVDENFSVNTRALILIVQLIGGLGFFFLLVEPLTNRILKGKEENKEIKSYKIHLKNLSANKIIGKSFASSLLLGVVGIFIIIWAFLFLPLAIEGFVCSLFFGLSFGILIFLWRHGNEENISISEIVKRPFKQTYIKKQIALGGILGLILYVIIYLSIGVNYFGMVPSIVKIPWVPIYLFVGFIIFMIYGLLYQVVLQRLSTSGFKGLFKSALLTCGLQFLHVFIYVLVLCLILGSFFYFGVMLPIIFPAFLLAGFVAAISYQKTKNVIVGPLTVSIYVILILSTVATYETTLSFIMGMVF